MKSLKGTNAGPSLNLMSLEINLLLPEPLSASSCFPLVLPLVVNGAQVLRCLLKAEDF